MEKYIQDKKNLYASIFKFLEESDEHNNEESIKKSFHQLIKIIKNQQIEKDVEEMRQFVKIIKSICEHHHRDQHFNERMDQLLLHYKEQIKQNMSNLEIFHIFENNKKIVLFLLKNDIITISDEIYKEMINKIENNGNKYCHFFIPELENYAGEEKMKYVKNEILNKDSTFFTDYEKKRQEGENDSHICSLIRQDSVEEFITYMNRYNISPLNEILPSVFETNPFLIENNNTTLIEYSAFFGSIQILRYLLMNNAKVTPSLWLFAIHSKNAELIHLLESNQVPPSYSKIIIIREEEEEEFDESGECYEQCLIESIKCHHNDIAEYIKNNLINQTEKDSQENEGIISNCIKYHNFSYFQNDSIIEYGFFYLYLYHYDKLFELLLKKKEKLLDKKINQYQNIQNAVGKNDVEVIYHYLLKMQELPEGIFTGTEIKQVAIPSSVTSIKEYAFYKCSALTQISIPSSLISIGRCAFAECSLTQITIPSSVTSIGDCAFCGCSLIQIVIPSSVISIGDCAFCGCYSLSKISIPSSVTSIGGSFFDQCYSLNQVSIPSSVVSIGNFAFSECFSLTQITIPSSIKSIGDFAFSGCLSLAQITIPSSVISIGKSAFSECSSLTQIEISSSLTIIREYSFSFCSSLTQISIPSSVTKILDHAFSECSSLTQITIPSSVTEIGFFAFDGCSSLTQITIPSSIDTKYLGFSPSTRIHSI